MSEKLEYADFLESGSYVKKLEETYNRYLDIRDKKLVEFMEENKRLHSIIKEVREYINEYAWQEDIINGIWTTTGEPMKDRYMQLDWDNCNELLEILDKTN